MCGTDLFINMKGSWGLVYLTTYKDQMIKPPAHHLNKKAPNSELLNEKQLIKRFTRFPISIFCIPSFQVPIWYVTEKRDRSTQYQITKLTRYISLLSVQEVWSSNMFFDSLSFSLRVLRVPLIPIVFTAWNSSITVLFFPHPIIVLGAHHF